jgi:hypothetical protein
MSVLGTRVRMLRPGEEKKELRRTGEISSCGFIGSQLLKQCFNWGRASTVNYPPYIPAINLGLQYNIKGSNYIE